MRWLCTLLLLLPLPLPAVAQFTNVLGLSVETNGYILRVVVGGDTAGSLGTNGGFFSALGTNNSLTSTTALTLTLTRMGYDDSGSGTTSEIKLYGTRIARVEGPLFNTNDIKEVNATNIIFRVALNDFVFARDSNITATARGGWLSGTNGNATNVAAVSLMTVTNNSAQNYTFVVANASRPRWMMITNRSDDQYEVSVVAFHRSGRERRPVRSVKAWAVDNLGNVSNTNTVTFPVVDYNWFLRGENAVVEYVVPLYYTNLFGLWVTNHWIAYPWDGDTPLASTDFPSSDPTPLWQSDWRFNNRSNLNFAHAVVATNGNDGTGFATNRPWNGLDTVNPPLPFATIGAALIACVDTNGLNGRPYLAGSYIYLQSSNAWTWSGGTGRRGTNGGGYCTIAAYPGIPRSDVVLQPISGLTGATNNLCFQNLTIRGTNNNFFQRVTNLWLDNCWVEFNGPGTAHVQDSPLWYFTHCTITNWNSQALASFSSQQSFPALVRGCDLSGFNQDWQAFTCLGNRRNRQDHAVSFTISQFRANSVTWTNQNSIFAFNTIMGIKAGGGAMLSYAGQTNTLRGFALVANVFEYATNSATGGFRTATTDGFQMTNAIIWCNLMTGAGWNMAYNETGSSPYWRFLWSIRGNYFADWNTAGDATLTPNAGRIGNQPIVYGVGLSDNVFAEIGGVGVHPGTFLPEFTGLNSIPDVRTLTLGGQHGVVLVKTNYYPRFTLDQGYQGTDQPLGTNGGGNYRLLSHSPLWQLKWTAPLNYDLDAHTTGASDAPFVFISGNVRKGAFF